MRDAAEFIRDKVSRLEREHIQALNKAKEYRVKAEEMSARANELAVLVRHVKQWQLEFNGRSTQNDTPSTPSDRDVAVSGLVPVRQLVGECLTYLATFSSNDLIAEVQKLNPQAKGSSVQGDLSRRKTDGHVEQMGKNMYRSLLFSGGNGGASQEYTDDLADPFADEEGAYEGDRPTYFTATNPARDMIGDDYEPGPDFGRIK